MWNPVGGNQGGGANYPSAADGSVMQSSMQTNIAGLRGTKDFGPNERPENFRETILFLNPNGEAPLTALMSKMASERTDDPTFHWFEEKLPHVRPELATGVDGSSPTITLSPATDTITGVDGLVPGDVLIVEPGPGEGVTTDLEQMLVQTVNSGSNALTVIRGFAGSTPASLSAGSRLTKVGTAFAEGTGSPNSTSRNPQELQNYCQIFKSTIDLTETSRKTKYRTGDLEKNEKKRKMFDHSRDMELAYFFGRKSLTTGANGKPRRTMAGLFRFIKTYTKVWDGSNPADVLTEDRFVEFVSQIFNWDGQGAGDERIAFCGNEALITMNILARTSPSTRINFDGYVSVYGMKMSKWILPQGTIYLKTHPLFNIHPVYSQTMVVINPRGLRYRYLRDTSYKPNVQANDEDTFKGQWLSECGLEVNHEETMCVMSGLTRSNMGLDQYNAFEGGAPEVLLAPSDTAEAPAEDLVEAPVDEPEAPVEGGDESGQGDLNI